MKRSLEVSSSQSSRNSAFAALVSFIENEVLRKNRLVFVSDLLAMYREEYTGVRGNWTDVQAYTAQNLTRKTEEHLKESHNKISKPEKRHLHL